MVLAIYFIIGLVWTFTVDKFSYFNLNLPPMRSKEIIFQVLLWPVGLFIFTFTFLREVFFKKN